MQAIHHNVDYAAKWGCVNKGVIAHSTSEVDELTSHSMALYSGVLLSWLEKYDSQYYYGHPLQEVKKLVSDTLDLLVGLLHYFSVPTTMLAVVIKYADAFVSRNGIRQVVLLHLLFISTISTIKMWGTENMAVNQIIADLFHLSLVDINNMEREFLKSLDYELYLTDADVAAYVASITATHVASVLRSRVRSTHTAKRVATATPVSISSHPYTRTAHHTVNNIHSNTVNKRKALYNCNVNTRRCKQPRTFLKPEIINVV